MNNPLDIFKRDVSGLGYNMTATEFYAVGDSIRALLQRQQSDAKLIGELVDMLEDCKVSCIDDEILFESLELTIQKANTRLKEDRNECN